MYIAVLGGIIKSKRMEVTSSDVREGTTIAVPTEGFSLTNPLHKMVHTHTTHCMIIHNVHLLCS